MQLIDHADAQDSRSTHPLSALLSVYTFLIGNIYVHVAILVALCFYCFFRALGGFFIADDFPEIAYVSNIFHGHTDLIWSNFTGNFMQVPGMKVYRPGLFLTVLIDWLVYGTKAWGYFLSNILAFTGCAVFLYFLCRALSSKWTQTGSVLFAFFSSALFAVNPLHCETIDWVVGRGDPYAALFYLLTLLSFVFFLEKPRPRVMALTVTMFAAALSIKEMPVGVPIVASVLAFFWTDDPGAIRSRLLNAGRLSLPLWFTLVVYFAIRYVCIGTLGGGYVDGLGASQLSAMIQHWTDRDTVDRIFLPVSAEVARQSLFALPALRGINTFVCSLAVLRLLSGCWSWRWVFLIAAMVFTSAAPIFQLWGLGPNLEGSRFYFFLSIPLSMLGPLLLFHPPRGVLPAGDTASDRADDLVKQQSSVSKPEERAINTGRYGRALTLLSVATQVILIVLMARITFRTTGLWVHAGKEDRHLSEECQKLAEQTAMQKQIVLFGVPDDYHGAHLILNRTMFELMLRPPIAKENFASRFFTTMPLMYGPEQFINGSGVREKFRIPDIVGPYIWERNKQKLELVALPAVSSQDLKPLSNLAALSNYPSGFQNREHRAGGSYWVILDKLDINPLVVDCIEFDLTSTELSGEPLKIYWTGTASPLPPGPEEEAPPESVASVKVNAADGRKTVRVRLGHYWRWYSCGRIKSLEIVPPAAKSCRIENIRLVPYSATAPTLKLRTNAQDHYLAVLTADKVDLELDKNALAGVSSMELEVSKGNFFFDNFADRTDVDPVAFRIPLGPSAKSLSLDCHGKYFPRPGYYQLRLRCLDERGKPIGEYSDPVTLVR